MKRVNGKKWTPWVDGRHLPIRGLPDPIEQKKLIENDYRERQAELELLDIEYNLE